MQIKILGTRGEIEPTARLHSKKSGVLIDNKILLDIGEKKFLEQKSEIILITHLHPDHAFFVRNPNQIIPKIAIPIFSPESYSHNVSVKKFVSKRRFDDYVITPIPTHHSLKVLSQAYLIETNNEKILYTGDMVWIDKKYHSKLRNLDLVITEASYIREGGLIKRDKKTGKIYGHTGVPNLMQLFSKFTKHILFVHFGSWFYNDIQAARKTLLNLGKAHNLKVHVGYDGMKMDTIKLS